MKKYILLIVCTVIGTWSIFAQQKTVEVTGTIVDEKGEPLIGATVVVKEKPGLGVASDIDGNYKIKMEAFHVSFVMISQL